MTNKINIWKIKIILKIRFNESVAEIADDLELQPGSILIKNQIHSLKTNKYTTFKKSELDQYWNDINEYLYKTEPS